MTRRLALSPRAEADLESLWYFTVREWTVAQAERYLAGLRDVFSLLADHPEIARLRTEIAPPVRLHPYRAHLVIFIATDTAVEILRVVHSRSDWAVLFED